MPINDLLELFGLPQNFTNRELRKKFNSLIKQHHPDKGGDPDMFRKILDAYELLLTRKQQPSLVKTFISLSPKELKDCLGEQIVIQWHDQKFNVLIPYETRIGDTVRIENILPNLTLLIKIKDKNEQPT